VSVAVFKRLKCTFHVGAANHGFQIRDFLADFDRELFAALVRAQALNHVSKAAQFRVLAADRFACAS